MSWKSLVTASLLCVVASPVFAAPTLTISGGRLTKPSAGTAVRVWNVAVTPDFTATGSNGAATPLAIEMGFEATGGNILTINSAQNATRVPSPDNPGNKIFGTETINAAANNNPTGLQLGSTWTPTAAPGKAFAAVGTAVFSNVGTLAQQRADLFTITTDAAVTSLKWGGAYTAVTGAYNAPTGTLTGVARVAQGTSATTAINYHEAGYTGTLANNAATRFMADMNGDTAVNFGDLTAFGQSLTGIPAYTTAFPNLNRIGRGDINGDGALNFGDLTGFGQIIGGNNPGSGSAVPEPASMALVALSILGGLGIRRRRS